MKQNNQEKEVSERDLKRKVIGDDFHRSERGSNPGRGGEFS